MSSKGNWPKEAAEIWNKRGSYGGRGGGRFDRSNNFNRRPATNRDRVFNRGNHRGHGGRGRYHGGDYSMKNRTNEQPIKVGKKLSETDICVSEYANKLPGFNGIIKSRFSDFQVSEISRSGEIAKLTSLQVPTPVSTAPKIESDEDLLTDKYNLELLPIDIWNKLNELVLSDVDEVKQVEINVTGWSKEQRTKIHEAVKNAFGDGIVGRTVDKQEQKFVIFDKPNRKGVRIDNRVKWSWPAEYVHFILYKENCDTMEAINKLCDGMRKKGIQYQMRPNLVGIAGTKDRRAKTTQWLSVSKVDPSKIEVASKGYRELRVGNFTFEDQPLSLGDLKGNRFRIVLRNVNTDSNIVLAACEELSKTGFINYYGLQRFGSRPTAPTHVIGAALLTKDYKKAISLILDPAPGRMQYALQEYANTRSADAALDCMPGYLKRSTYEGKILIALAQNPNNFAGATDSLPRNMRLLYIHSYQSYVWNNVASQRVASHGLKPVVGDLVLDTEKITSKDIKFEETINDGLENADLDEGNADYGNDEAGGDDDDQEDDEKESEKSEPQNEKETDGENGVSSKQPKSKKNKNKKEPKILTPVKILTQEDIDSGKYTIFDVILPLPGYNVKYPPNLVDYYTEVMAKDNLTLTLKNRDKKLSLSGNYRPLMAIPEDMTYKLVKYNDPHCDLLISDLDELNGKNDIGVVEDGKFTALILQFSLPSSCYATMALRELLKANTGADTQAAQNSYHEDPKKGETQNKNNESEEKNTNVGDKMETEGERKRKTEDSPEEECKRVRPESLESAVN